VKLAASLLAPALLCAVAVLQIWTIARAPLSPWKGGGFGMYSGVDSLAARFLRPVLLTPAGELPVSFDRLLEDRPELAPFASELRAWPDAGRLAALVDALAGGGRGWADCTPAPLGRAAPGLARVSAHFVRSLPDAERKALGCARLNVSALRLELWRYRYEGEGRVVRAEKLVEGVAERRARGAEGRRGERSERGARNARSERGETRARSESSATRGRGAQG
jgi:hypothetical protein